MSRARPTLPDRLAAAYEQLGVRGPLVLAVSGGADSTALLRGTLSIAQRLGLCPVVAHFDHGLRQESATDAAWVVHQAAAFKLDVLVERGDVPTLATEGRIGIEEAARRLRYDFLTRVAVEVGARFVATAHTADDLVETVLFHVLRGTGLRGLRGIVPRRRLSDRITLVRPMLDVTRAEVERYLDTIGQGFITDPTNADSTFTRNRIRHKLMPVLREAVNPRLDQALRRLAVQADEASALLRKLAKKQLGYTSMKATPETIRLRCRRLKAQPRILIRETVALAWRRAGWPRQAMGFDHWDALAELVVCGGRRTLPGGTDARRRQGELILRRPPA